MAKWNEGQIEWISFCASTGIILNLILLYLIFTDKNQTKDGYRRMLAIITFYNIYYALVHWITEVGILIDSTGFLSFSYRFAQYGFWVSFLGIQLYSFSFVTSLLLLAIHCLYRYVKVSGKWNKLFDRWEYLSLLIGGHIFFAALDIFFTNLAMMKSAQRDALSQSDLFSRYNLSIDNLGYLGPVYRVKNGINGDWVYLWENVIGTAGCIGVQMIVYTSICICGIKLYFFVRKSLISCKWRKMNLQLLRLLLIQAISPLIFEYIPFFVTLLGGLIGLSFAEASFYIPIVVSCYPAAEAIMTITGFTMLTNSSLILLNTIGSKFCGILIHFFCGFNIYYLYGSFLNLVTAFLFNFISSIVSVLCLRKPKENRVNQGRTVSVISVN